MGDSKFSSEVIGIPCDPHDTRLASPTRAQLVDRKSSLPVRKEQHTAFARPELYNLRGGALEDGVGGLKNAKWLSWSRKSFQTVKKMNIW